MRQPMPEQDPKNRIKTSMKLLSATLKEQAIAEAKRCIQCKKPSCIAGCPVEIDIPAFIALIADGKFDEAAKKLKEKNNLPAICGRVCPQENQCEKVCVFAKKKDQIAIGRLERFAADWEIKKTGDQRSEARGEQNKTARQRSQLSVQVRRDLRARGISRKWDIRFPYLNPSTRPAGSFLTVSPNSGCRNRSYASKLTAYGSSASMSVDILDRQDTDDR